MDRQFSNYFISNCVKHQWRLKELKSHVMGGAIEGGLANDFCFRVAGKFNGKINSRRPIKGSTIHLTHSSKVDIITIFPILHA